MNENLKCRLKLLLKEAAAIYEEIELDEGVQRYEREDFVAPTRLKQTTVDTDPWYTKSY